MLAKFGNSRMYDKVKFWLDRGLYKEEYSAIVNSLENATISTDKKGETWVNGNLGNLKISAQIGGLSVVGSLPKYLYGHNAYNLDLNSTGQAIEKIEDDLHISIGGAHITEIEFGSTFQMQKEVSEYLLRLGEAPRLCRGGFGTSTLYYTGKGKRPARVLAFYDKAKEMGGELAEIPAELRGKNLLRFEMRERGRLGQRLGVPRVTASTLTQRAFYTKMIKRYKEGYFSIAKQNQLKTNAMDGIKTVSQAYDAFVAQLIMQSKQGQAQEFIEDLKRAGVFKDRKDYTRLKNRIARASTGAKFVEADELIKELDDDIINCCAYG